MVIIFNVLWNCSFPKWLYVSVSNLRWLSVSPYLHYPLLLPVFLIIILFSLVIFDCAASLLLFGLFSSCGELGLFLTAVRGLLIAVTSLVAKHGL